MERYHTRQLAQDNDPVWFPTTADWDKYYEEKRQQENLKASEREQAIDNVINLVARSGAQHREPPQPPPPIHATPFAWRHPKLIPPRCWLYGRHYVRKNITCTIAVGGVGKTSMAIVEALAMVSMKPLLGVQPSERARVWIWNGEDPRDELDRRIAAAMQEHGVTPDDVEGYLFSDVGREMQLIIATQARTGAVAAQPVVDAVIETIIHNRIDVVIIDPFIKSHHVNENDNAAIDAVVTQWSTIADAANCAVELLHHPRKTGGADGMRRRETGIICMRRRRLRHGHFMTRRDDMRNYEKVYSVSLSAKRAL
jgi:AAA domain-containing protein